MTYGDKFTKETMENVNTLIGNYRSNSNKWPPPLTPATTMMLPILFGCCHRRHGHVLWRQKNKVNLRINFSAIWLFWQQLSSPQQVVGLFKRFTGKANVFPNTCKQVLDIFKRWHQLQSGNKESLLKWHYSQKGKSVVYLYLLQATRADQCF